MNIPATIPIGKGKWKESFRGKTCDLVHNGTGLAADLTSSKQNHIILIAKADENRVFVHINHESNLSLIPWLFPQN